MTDFDFIVGIDRVASCYEIVDCHAKTVKFTFMSEDLIIIKGGISPRVGKFISTLRPKN